MAKRSGLGKGLDSLIGGGLNFSSSSDNTIEKENNAVKETETMIKIRMIEPNRNQPRKKFDEDGLEELAESIKLYGIIQPLIVCKRTGYYEIIAGERRWRAAKIAGLKEVPVIVKEYTDKQIAEISLVENLQREDLNPIEEAMAYKRLLEEFQLTQEQISDCVSKSRSVITNALRLLKLNEKIQTMLIEGLITIGHAKALLSLNDEEKQLVLAERIIDEKLSVRGLEYEIKLLLNPRKHSNDKKELENQPLYHSLEEKMKERMGTKVLINRKSENKGKIEIEYYSSEDLERIIDKLGLSEE